MSSRFVSENELADARKQRQEEWDKVRTADQPTEPPEEPYDSRSLYDRLKEQKIKKDMQYEEEHKLKNMIRGLDTDEADYLEMVEKNKNNCHKQQIIEEKRELEDFRKQVANLKKQDALNKTRLEPSTKKDNIISPSTNSQRALLGLGVKRKIEKISPDKPTVKGNNKSQAIPYPLQNQNPATLDNGLLKCIAILPGIGTYPESSDSEASTDSGEELAEQLYREQLDLLGRKPPKKKNANSSN